MFKVQFIVSAARLEKLLNTTEELGLKHSAIEHVRQEEDPIEQGAPVEPKIPTRALDDDIISLTAKRPTKGSMREKVVIVLEKLEVKHGVGAVTRKVLRAQTKKLGLDPQILYQLTADGYIVNL